MLNCCMSCLPKVENQAIKPHFILIILTYLQQKDKLSNQVHARLGSRFFKL